MKKEIDNTMWINCTYHNEKIQKLEKEVLRLANGSMELEWDNDKLRQENKQLRKIVLEMEMEAIDLEKENNKLKEIYINLADTVCTIEEERLIEAANLEYP